MSEWYRGGLENHLRQVKSLSCGFESRRFLHTRIAQWREQQPPKLSVVGSIPTPGVLSHLYDIIVDMICIELVIICHVTINVKGAHLCQTLGL